MTGTWHEYSLLVKNLAHPAWLEHEMNTTSCSWTWLILPDWSMTWIQLPVHELDSSFLTPAWHEYNFWLRTWLVLPDWNMTWIQLPVHKLDSSLLTGALHEYNFLVMNLAHPAWLEHDINTISWSWTWLILPDSSLTWMQLAGQEIDLSCLTGAWHEYNFLIKNFNHPAWLEHDMNTTSWSWTWLILPDSSITWIQLPGHELDSSCLTRAWNEYIFLVMNLTHPARLKHDMNTTSWSRTWLILPDWGMTWIQLPGQELDSSCLTGAWHEYNFLVKNLTHPAWLEHDMNTTSRSRTSLILPDSIMTWMHLPVHELLSSCPTGAWHEYNFLVKNFTHPAWLNHDMNASSWLWTSLILQKDSNDCMQENSKDFLEEDSKDCLQDDSKDYM
jgi:hypothetical protein